MVIQRFDIFYVNLDPTQGSEIRKSRPCVIVSPEQLNKGLNTVIIAPLTSTIKSYPFRLSIIVEGRAGQIALDQIRTIDKSRLQNKISALDADAQFKVLELLQEMFMY